MTVALVTAALVALSVLVILRPLALGRARPLMPAGPADEARDRLLRQLRDLDEDLASDKLDAADHARLREPVERAAAEVLHELSVGAGVQARGDGRGPTSGPEGSPDRGPDRTPGHSGAEPGGQAEPARGTRRRAWLVGLGAGAVVAVGIGALLVTSTAPRAPGETITGDAPTGGPQSGGGAQATAGGTGAAGAAGSSAATPQQLAAVAAAEADVRRDPKDPRAHLALARAYTAAAAPQLATIEYLAVTRLDRTDPEANAALALVALASGRPEEAVTLVDTALAAHPRHPEALYARGIVRLMGLGQVAAGKQDLDAYLVAAPFGSHRAAVETLLAMIPRGAAK